MAAERIRRANAGSNISKLLRQEEDLDGFYSTAYGGFEEVSGDEKYSSEEEEEDHIDSDFDKPEDDGHDSDQIELDEPKTKKKKLSQITAKSVSRDKAARKQEDQNKSSTSQAADKTRRAKVSKKAKPPAESQTGEERGKSLRKSTLKHTQDHQKMRKQKEKKIDGRKVKRAPAPPLTQAELLEAAKLTEVENLKSLEAFTKLEEEKKKTVERHRVIKGPAIRYLSVTMPIVEESPSKKRAAVKSLSQSSAEELPNPSSTQTLPSHSPNQSLPWQPAPLQTSQSHSAPSVSVPTATQPVESSDIVQTGTASDDLSLDAVPHRNHSRNFLIFTDSSSYPSQYFSRQKRKNPRRRFCPITAQPAKYFDPLTKTPYATVEAFKVLRSRYVDTEQQKCDKRLIQLSSWLEEKKRQMVVNVT